MIAQLTGTCVRAGATDCVLDVAGVGYLLQVTPATAASLRPGEQARLSTSLVLRQDSVTLFGFADDHEREAFELAQSASGVGPKLALAIVSVLSPSDFRKAVSSQDLARLTAVPGIGKKGAEKICIELRDKVALLADADEPGDEPTPEVAGEELWRVQVSEGLTGLGWSARDAEAACESVAYLVEETPDIGVAKLLRAALTSLARR